MAPANDQFTTIASPNNPRINRIRRLHLREERERTGLFFAEGIRFVAQAVQQEAHIEHLVVAPRLLVNPFGQKLVRQQRRLGTPCLQVTPAVFRSLARADAPQGLAAVVRQRWEPLAQARPAEGLCWLALHMVQSPGNLGTIIRTCEAVGAAGLILIGDATDPYDPAAVRATMGAVFNQRFVRTTFQEFATWKQQHRCFLVGTAPGAAVDYHAISYRFPVILFIGWERRGLSPHHQALCDLLVKIPMVGTSDSLNVAVATGVMLYELFNQRRATRQ